MEYSTVTFEDSSEMARKVFDKVIEWYKKHKQFSGEGIMQDDDPIIDAPHFLSDLADEVIKFDEHFHEDDK
jgi:hypothetical protein